MPESEHGFSQQNPDVDRRIAEYLAAVDAGREPDRAQFIAQHPDCTEALARYFENLEQLELLMLATPESGGNPNGNEPAEPPETVDVSVQSTEQTKDTWADASRERQPTKTPGRQFGDYELLGEVARGGMGVVYKARQKSLNRIVALKMILSGQLAGEQQIQRFRAEAVAAANLDHPGIVPVYEVGEHAGQHFFSMGYVEGESLAQRVARGPLPPREAAELTKAIAEAVAYAHSKGVIHRDLKPGNVLLAQSSSGGTGTRDRSGASPSPPDQADEAGDASIQPRVTDFGLAKQLGDDSSLTATGQVMGTPSFMPPEQAQGRLDEIGECADVYSLGAILYCLLTGRPPFQAANVVETLKQVVEQDPVPPRQLNPALDRDAETIALKCLEKDAARRYPSASELAEDLGRYLNREPIHARPVGRTERAWRWSRRHPGAASAVATVVVAVLVLAAALGVISSQNEALASAFDAVDNKNEELIKTNADLTVARDAAEDKRQEAEDVLRFFEENVLAAARPENLGGGLGVNATIRDAVDAAESLIAESFKDRPLVEASLRNTLGLTYESLGEADLAIRQHQRARKLRAANLDSTHPDLLTSMNNLGTAYQDAGRLDEARQLFEETLKLRTAELGQDHPDTLISMNNLAYAYSSAGRLRNALSRYEETRKLRTELLGSTHVDTLTSMNNLATAYEAAGRLNEALSLFEETLKLTRTTLGPDHLYTLRTMNCLATTYKSVGRLDDALRLYEQSRDLLVVKLGQDHPHTLIAMLNLAIAYRNDGRLDEALPLFEEVLSRMTATLDPQHPAVLGSMQSLATAYGAVGRLDEALPLFEKTLKLRQAKFDQDHPETLKLMNGLATAYQAAGRLNDALALYERTLELMQAKLGPDHPDTLNTMNNLAVTLRSLNRPDEALALYEKTLEVMQIKLGPRHPETLNTMNNMAVALRSLNRLDEALPLFEETLELRRETLDLDHPDTLLSMANLAWAYKSAGRLPEALPMLEETVKLMTAKLGRDHPLTLSTMHNLAAAYVLAARVDESLPLYEETLKLRTTRLGRDHPDTLMTMTSLGTTYRSAGRLHDALPLFEESFNLVKARLGPGHRYTISAMGNLATVYLEAAQPQRALPLFEQYVAAQRRRTRPGDPRFASMLEQISLGLLQHRQHAAAETYLRECLANRQQTMPRSWQLFSTKSLLGGALAGQAQDLLPTDEQAAEKKFAEAEALLLEGYQGMKQRRAQIPAAKERLTEAAKRLVALYTAWGQSDNAAKWKSELGQTTGSLSN